MQEEREMWHLRELERTAHWQDVHVHHSRSMITRGRLLSDTLHPPSPHHYTHSHYHQDTFTDDDVKKEREEERERKWKSEDVMEEGYWTKRLLKQEENDPTRYIEIINAKKSVCEFKMFLE